MFFDIKWAGYKRSVFPCAQVRTLLLSQTANQKQQQQKHGARHGTLKLEWRYLSENLLVPKQFLLIRIKYIIEAAHKR